MPHIEVLDWNLHTHIALDLDETLAHSVQNGLDSLHALGKMKQIPTTDYVTNFICRDLPGADMTNEEIAAFWQAHRLSHVAPIEDALRGVRLLDQLEKELSIITARHGSLHRGDTETWVKIYFPYISVEDIYFVNHTAGENQPKGIVCREQGISLLIDDGYHNIVEALTHDITCIMLDKPWNRQETLEHPLLYRANNWEEIINSLQPYVS